METQRIPYGSLDGVMQISLISKPLVVASSRVIPKSEGHSKRVRRQFKVYDERKLNELDDALARAFDKMSRELRKFDKNNPIP